MSHPSPARWPRRAARGVLVAVSISILMLTAACGGTKGGGAATGEGSDTLFIGTVNPPASFNPINQSDSGGQWALGFAMDTLLVQTAPLEFEPKLADSFDTQDNKVFTVALNPKATWSDGEPITAEDVVFTFNLIAHPDSATALGQNMSMFAGTDTAGKLPKGETELPWLKAVDEHTVEFRMKSEIDPNWVKEMVGTAIYILPSHALKNEDPAKFGESKFAAMPDIFSGPYKITKYTNNVNVEYAANESYYLGNPKIARMIMKIMPAPNLAGELQTGSIHMNSGGGIGNVPITDLPTMQEMTGIKMSVNPTLDYQTIQFNTKALTSKELRQGMAHAINRKQIVDQLLKGEGEIVDGPYTSQSPYLDKSLNPRAYDPELAKELIAKSGWDVKKPIKFVVPTGNATREQAADIMQQNWKAAGLNIQAERYDFPTTMAMEQDGKFDVGLMGLSATVDPDVSNQLASTGGFNLSQYDNPKSDKLLAQAKAEPDPAKRKEIYAELQKIWQEDVPVLTTYSDRWIAAKSASLEVGGAQFFYPATTANLQDWKFGAQ
jgi:peptide/nickel transport system substrate-binding protein